MFPKHYADLFYSISGCPPVNHSMAVGANRFEVRYGLDFVFFSNCRKGTLMVNVNKASPHCAIVCLKVEAANITACPVIRDAPPTSLWITLVGVHQH